MKSMTKIVIQLFVLVGLVLTSSCGGDDPSASEVALKKLMAQPWHLSNALVDGTDKTSVYSGLSITFTKTNFTATNVTPSWPATGTWKFSDKSAKEILRGDDLLIDIIEINDGTLKISYRWNSTTFESGRANSVSGNHVLTFVKTI